MAFLASLGSIDWGLHSTLECAEHCWGFYFFLCGACSFTGQVMTFDPGFVNTTIYGDRVESGWSWFPYNQNTDSFWSPVRASIPLSDPLQTLRVLPCGRDTPALRRGGVLLEGDVTLTPLSCLRRATEWGGPTPPAWSWVPSRAG